MRCKKNGVTVEELTEDGEGYKLWDARAAAKFDGANGEKDWR